MRDFLCKQSGRDSQLKIHKNVLEVPLIHFFWK